MSADHQVPAVVVSSSTENSVRHIADFHPSIWGNYFLNFTSDFKTLMNTATEEEYEAVKEEVRRMITATNTPDKPAEKLLLIDAVQRFGVAYHFEKEIQYALDKIHHDHNDNDYDNDDLYYVSLQFRLFRQAAIKISSDVFEKFKDNEGKFKASLITDVQSMLSLYEAAHLAIPGEGILDEAIAFTTTNLNSMLLSSSHHVNPSLAEQINHVLFRSLRRALPRVEARYSLDTYPKDDSQYNNILLRFAKLDFNIVQAMHQKELSDLTRWWKDLDVTTKLPYVRDRLVELYFWVLAIYFEPRYTFGRRMLTKVCCLLTILDDNFDSFGKLEELRLFTEVVKRWNIDAMDKLPEYMKSIYKIMLNLFNEIEEDMTKQGRLYCMYYAKKTLEEVVQAYLEEAVWFNVGYVPTMEEYYPVALVTGGHFLVTTITFLGMGEIATEESFHWLSNNPNILKATTIIVRLMDDIATHKFEQKRGHVASAIERYMKQHGVSEEEAAKVLKQEIGSAWKDINGELLKLSDDVPNPLLERFINLARAIDFMYKDGKDHCTHSYLMKDHVASLLRDPVI